MTINPQTIFPNLVMTPNAISGLLNLNKPMGITSHDVVQRVRRILGTKKVGHTGTLDPMATGVLVICVGQATRLIEYLLPGKKIYQAGITLGQSTDTYDAEGDVTATHDPSQVTQTDFIHSLEPFIGEIQQIPPAFSAIKQNGVPLYKLARQGKNVSSPARNVQIYSIEILKFENPLVEVKVTCGSGTYIRSLAHDVGNALGVGAHLSALTRIQNGEWRIEDAISLDELERAAQSGHLADVIVSKERTMAHMPKITLSPENEKRALQGQRIPLDTAPDVETDIAAFNTAGQLIAMLCPREPGLFKPRKVFLPQLEVE